MAARTCRECGEEIHPHRRCPGCGGGPIRSSFPERWTPGGQGRVRTGIGCLIALLVLVVLVALVWKALTWPGGDGTTPVVPINPGPQQQLLP
jgi:hypothetical protein